MKYYYSAVINQEKKRQSERGTTPTPKITGRKRSVPSFFHGRQTGKSRDHSSPSQKGLLILQMTKKGLHAYANCYGIYPLSPGAAVMICSKCPLTIPGRRYRLPVGVIVSPLRSEGIRRASNYKQVRQHLSRHPSNTLTMCGCDLHEQIQKHTPA